VAAKIILANLLRVLLALYLAAFQIGLAWVLFVLAVPYLYLTLLPIPVLLPLAIAARIGSLRRVLLVYLWLQIAGVTVQMVLRILLDLWLPVRI
jgi:hypothetical protein